MKSIKIGIVEDELIIADNIIAALKELGYDTTEACITYTQALEMVEQENPDLVLLDIQLAGKKSGIDVAETLNRDYNIPFIFLTSNADTKTVEEAKKVNPYAYLVKPFNKEDLFTAIEIALSNFNQNKEETSSVPHSKLKNTIFLKKKDTFFAVRHQDILFIKSDHVYLEVYTSEEVFITRNKLEDFINKLSNKDFFQVHRRYFVNLTHIESINHEHLVVKGNEVPMNKNYRAELMKIIDVS